MASVHVQHVHQDDVVEYRLYPVLKDGLTEENEIASSLEECLDLYLAHLSPFLIDYIWQSEPFRLQSVGSDSNCSVPCHLFGATHFGDNIEDEWFIVFLLYQLTTAFPGLLASIQDSDGNFLLIEAAYHLPRWLNPETSENRVFIYNGELHVIPRPNNPAEIVTLPGGVPSVQQALDLVRSNKVVTHADELINEDIQKRISKFPDHIKEDWHYTHCCIPARLAMVIQHKPSLIAAAIQAFYQRDPIDLRACRVMKYFPPEDMVMSQVKFTRCLYAQLTQQKFHPDQRSGWRIPAQSNPRYKSCTLGMKLAHGFEILCSRCVSSGTAAAACSQDDGGINVTSGVRWQRYLDSLKKKGYFRGELEGSKLYTELLESAKKFFIGTISSLAREDSSKVGHQIIEILQTVPCDVDAWKKSERNLPPSQDDSWLDLTPEQLDKMLENAAGRPPEKQSSSLATPNDDKSDGNPVDADVDLESVTKGIKTFVDKVSSYEGAEFPKGLEDGAIKFDANMFEDALENILSYRRAGPADDSDDSEDDSDGDEDFDTEDDDDENGEMKQDDLEMMDLMDQMDKELAGTEMGKSFEREQHGTKDDQSPGKTKMADLSAGASGSNHSHAGETDEDHRPVEVDVNLLKNMLESYSSQQGLSGPASNILHSMGVHLPPDNDKTT